jgi:hypothetical protein
MEEVDTPRAAPPASMLAMLRDGAHAVTRCRLSSLVCCSHDGPRLERHESEVRARTRANSLSPPLVALLDATGGLLHSSSLEQDLQ